MFVVSFSQTISISSTHNNPNCGINDGSIDISVAGGSGNYQYMWSTGDTLEDITGLVEVHLLSFSITVEATRFLFECADLSLFFCPPSARFLPRE